ncbi:hypothetical protein AT05_10120 [Schleiferia thermophila str. Yellowstone]|nr:hypothetical protein AT05_10120 [Schleiferia thermophila str. Yellowstone]GCD80835.1 hypothetical protein JCM30197_20820 [Schleiferia thermophila]
MLSLRLLAREPYSPPAAAHIRLRPGAYAPAGFNLGEFRSSGTLQPEFVPANGCRPGDNAESET